MSAVFPWVGLYYDPLAASVTVLQHGQKGRYLHHGFGSHSAIMLYHKDTQCSTR